MPTFETLPRFERDWKNLTSQHVIWRRIGTHAIFTPPPGP